MQTSEITRIGILLDANEVPIWVNEMIIHASRIKSVELVGVLVGGSTKQGEKLLTKIYNKVDNKLLPGKPTITSLTQAQFSPESEIITLTLVSQSVSQAEVDLLVKSKIDVLLFPVKYTFQEAFANVPIKKWAITIGENQLTHDTAGFWDWYYKSPTNKISLLEYDQSIENNKIIASAITKADSLSMSRNKTLVFSKAADLVITSLGRLKKENALADDKQSPELKLKPTPSELHFILASLKLAFRFTLKALNKIMFVEQWALFIARDQNLVNLKPGTLTKIVPPKDRFWADPFIVSLSDKDYIFVEELPFATQKGHLSCLVLDKQGRVETSQVILDKPYHLSYPFVFQLQGKWYMIPESAENKTVDLFECAEFPFRWQHKRTLMPDVNAYDSTIHFADGRYWLFCTMHLCKGGSPNDELHIFYTDDLLNGEWTPHKMNPVVSGPYQARPAGKIFEHEGMWYRPSQVCIPRYGYALSVNRIDHLDESNYRETKVREINPDWHPQLIANHTYNSDKNICVLDGQLKRWRF